MKYELVKSNECDIERLIEYKRRTIYEYAYDIDDELVNKIEKYVKETVPMLLDNYCNIVVDGKVVGCLLVTSKDDGVLLDEIFIEEDYRNNGIGSSIITKVINDNDIVYLYVYKDNKNAIKLYKRLGFNIIEDTDVRYYMKHNNLKEANDMNIELLRANKDDIDELMEMQKESFKPLLDRYNDGDKNPYNDPYEKYKFKIDNCFYYFIIIDGVKVGAISIYDKNDGSKKKIAPIYILPKYQNRGYGQLAMKEVERIHGEDNWKLDTILEEKGNCHLYEKFGYKQTGKFEKISDIQTIVFYEK